MRSNANTATHSRLRHAVIFLCMALCALGTLAAEKRVALLIGNANYASAPLRNPPNDVREMQAALTSIGFRVQVVLNANQNQMRRAVRDFGDAAQGADLAFLYYSGHGTQAAGENYLIPVGAVIGKESDYAIEAVSANTMLAQIAGARPKAAIVVLDACRDNPFASSTKSTGKGLARMEAPTGTMIAFATSPNTTASDEGHYARVLAGHIKTPGLELLQVFRNTGAEVRRITQGKQEPRISEVSINDNVYLAGQKAGVQMASVTPERVPQAPPERESGSGVLLGLPEFEGEARAMAALLQDIVGANMVRSKRIRRQVLDQRLGANQRPDPALWSGKGLAYLVGGSVKIEPDGRYVVQVRLHQVGAGTVDLGGTSYTVAERDFRLAAHQASDFIHQKITGEPSRFTRRQAYAEFAGDKWRLLVADSDGENSQPALTSGKPIGMPTWSSDARLVSYVSLEAATPLVFVHELVTGRRRKVADPQAVLGACGREIAMLQVASASQNSQLLRDSWGDSAPAPCTAALAAVFQTE